MKIQAYKPKDVAALKLARPVLEAHLEAIRSDDTDAARSEVWYLERFLDAIDDAIEEREAPPIPQTPMWEIDMPYPATRIIFNTVQHAGKPITLEAICVATAYPLECVSAVCTLLAIDGAIAEGPSGSYSIRAGVPDIESFQERWEAATQESK